MCEYVSVFKQCFMLNLLSVFAHLIPIIMCLTIHDLYPSAGTWVKTLRHKVTPETGAEESNLLVMLHFKEAICRVNKICAC